MRFFGIFLLLSVLFFLVDSEKIGYSGNEPAPDLEEVINNLENELVAKHGEGIRSRLQRGIRQAAKFWRATDGDATAFEALVRSYFFADPEVLEQTFHRFELASEQLEGHLHEINVEFRRQSDLDLGPLLPIDEILGAYDPFAHVNDDFFENRLGFVALLNFPLTTLEERLAQGASWSRREWAEVRLAQRFSRRVPAEVSLEIGKASSDSAFYISEYNIWMHHVLDEKGKRLFPPKLRLLSHWNLRDEIRAAYSETNGLPKQRMIQKVMERIVTQTIPSVVVNNPHVDWNPETNQVTPASVNDSAQPAPADLKVTNDPEPNTRYEKLLNNFQAAGKEDPYSPTAPTVMDRKFNEEREIPETRVRTMFESILSSPLVARVAKVIESRLGRKLEPFDLWYTGFRPRQKYTEAQLDEIVSRKYPTAEAFAADIPNILQKLGFTKERSEYLASKIVVEPARGSGHAWGAERRGDVSRLRTRMEKNGMNYKGYNIAIHELGHNVEQTFSLYEIDSIFLQGVPNTAFTEALAFVFQAHDLELLRLAKPDAASEAFHALNTFWDTYEIAGVGLVDMAIWRWMYEHPDATPAQLKDATVQIARDLWNRYYAPVFGKRDVVLLGIYSHMIERALYLPDYPIGHLIAFQIEEQVKRAGNLGTEFERMAKIGSVAPDLWMTQATGAPVGPEALIRATETALQQISPR